MLLQMSLLDIIQFVIFKNGYNLKGHHSKISINLISIS